MSTKYMTHLCFGLNTDLGEKKERTDFIVASTSLIGNHTCSCSNNAYTKLTNNTIELMNVIRKLIILNL